MDLLIGIAGSLIAAALATLLAWSLPPVRARFRSWRASSTEGRPREIALLQWLEADQTLEGDHKGEFGIRRNPSEVGIYETQAEPATSAKPRLWETAWACRVLGKYQLRTALVARAVNGVSRLLNRDGLYTIVEMGAAGLSPHSPAWVVSRRHTLRIADILIRNGAHQELSDTVVARMTDSSAAWQSKSGGWSPYDRKQTEPDLWATVYAINVLHSMSHRHYCSVEAPIAKRIVESLDASLDWLQSAKASGQWGDDAPALQNLPLVVAEVAPSLSERRLGWASQLRREIESLLTAAGTLREDYLSALKHVTPEAAAVRVAFALCQLGAPPSTWTRLVSVGSKQWADALCTPEVAMLIHLLRMEPVGAAHRAI